jgi:hypothetical protein
MGILLNIKVQGGITMQKKLAMYFMIILATLTLTACSKKYNSTNTYIEEQDFQYTYKKGASFQTIAESKEGYYFLSGYYLYYADKSTMKPVILCNKPNCPHEDETDPEKVIYCNAFFYGDGGVTYFDGNVYVLDEILEGLGARTAILNKLSKDGTKRKTVVKFKYPPRSMAIHRGKVYVTSTVYKSDGTPVYGINVYDLNKSSSQKPVTIYEGELPGGNIQDIICYGQNLYFMEYAHNTKIVTTRIMRYDIETRKTSCMFKEKGDTFPGNFTFLNDRILFSFTALDKETGEVLNTEDLQFALDGTDGKESFETEPYDKIYTDGKYIYLDDLKWSDFSKPKEEQCLNVTDENGKVLASAKTGNYSKLSQLIPGSKEHLFLENTTDTMYQIYYAEKKDFESGFINFKIFFEIDKEKMTPATIIKY